MFLLNKLLLSDQADASTDPYWRKTKVLRGRLKSLIYDASRLSKSRQEAM